MTKFYTIQQVGTESPRPQIARDGMLLSHQGTIDELNALRAALEMTHKALLHEIDNGRTPYLLQGVGIGFIEDVLNGAYNCEHQSNSPTADRS